MTNSPRTRRGRKGIRVSWRGGALIFASVLFFVDIAKRFRLRGVRMGANAIALVLLAYTFYGVGSLPRI